MAQRQVKLKNAKQPLHIPYPTGYKGPKSSGEEKAFFLNTLPRFLYDEEITIAKDYVAKLPYPQSVISTGCILIGNDPLLQFTQDELDNLEKENNLAATRQVPSGGERSLYERVLLIRETGYTGVGRKQLNPA